MDNPFKIQLIPYDRMESILPLVFVLSNEQIEYKVLKERLKDMLAIGGYECIGGYDDDELVGICEFWVLNKLHSGKHVEPDNVTIQKEYRNRGVGQFMIDYLFEACPEYGL